MEIDELNQWKNEVLRRYFYVDCVDDDWALIEVYMFLHLHLHVELPYYHSLIDTRCKEVHYIFVAFVFLFLFLRQFVLDKHSFQIDNFYCLVSVEDNLRDL